MATIYQSIFFLAIALLAITITVFVLAVSLLGRAVRLSAQQQTEAEEERKKDTENQITRIGDKLEQAKAAERVDVEDLSRSLRDLEIKDSRHKWKLRWIKIKPKLLTATWGALIPGAFFLISAIFSALSFYHPGGTAMISLYMWISLIALGIGVCFVCLALKVIEGVAITSEEAAFVREKELFKESLKEVEEEKKSVLGLRFEGGNPPFEMEAESEMTIKFNIDLSRGDVGKNASVVFLAPPGFSFPDSTASIYISGKQADHVSSLLKIGDVSRAFYRRDKVKIKAPSKPDNYTAYYLIACEGFDSDWNEFGINVKEPLNITTE